MTTRIRAVTLCLLGLATHHARAEPLQSLADGPITPVVQRLLAYEQTLGFPLSPRVGLCIDAAMGRTWSYAVGAGEDKSPATVDRLRGSAETCAVRLSGEKTRLVPEIQVMLEHQLILAKQISKPLADSRNCVSTSSSVEVLEPCVTKALGQAPSSAVMKVWRQLLEQWMAQ